MFPFCATVEPIASIRNGNLGDSTINYKIH